MKLWRCMSYMTHRCLSGDLKQGRCRFLFRPFLNRENAFTRTTSNKTTKVHAGARLGHDWPPAQQHVGLQWHFCQWKAPWTCASEQLVDHILGTCTSTSGTCRNCTFVDVCERAWAQQRHCEISIASGSVKISDCSTNGILIAPSTGWVTR